MADTIPTLRDAAQQLLKAIEGVRQAETSQGHGRHGFIRTAPTHEHQRRVADAWRKHANAVDQLRAALLDVDISRAVAQPSPIATQMEPVAEIGDLVLPVRERVMRGGAKNRDKLYVIYADHSKTIKEQA